ncbi:hypothetical protein Bca52824_039353 [Brassica carinata]|uniref:Uncharacterized protein n=1 Tax=Brassica carinata TaxID=52824 RepID=A0A8X7RP69_BRACI|nr:hypothetical protein Bca52824_039353 [Brassica carinata]
MFFSIIALSLVGAVAHEFMVLHLALKFELLHLLAATFCSECALLLHGSFLYKPDNRTDYTHTAAEPSLQNRVASSASFRSVKKPAISSNGDLVVEHVNMILYELFHSLRPPEEDRIIRLKSIFNLEDKVVLRRVLIRFHIGSRSGLLIIGRRKNKTSAQDIALLLSF